LARKVRAQRILETENRRHGFRYRKPLPTLAEFLQRWREEVAIGRATSTRRGYETALQHHLLPAFGSTPLDEITKTTVRTFMTKKGEEQRWDYTLGKRPNPDRPTLSEKPVRNMAAVLHTILASAVEDFELLDRNPLDGVLRQRRRRRFPTRRRPRTKPKVHIIEPDDFKRALEAIPRDDTRRMVLMAALSGLRWGEQVALRVEDINWRRNRIVVSRALYRRIPGAPKTEGSECEVPICPTVRRILQLTPWKQGYIFSRDGVTSIGDGSWIKRCWREAQQVAGIAQPVSWHELRHFFVSMLIAAGKHPKVHR
jgi:integrase